MSRVRMAVIEGGDGGGDGCCWCGGWRRGRRRRRKLVVRRRRGCGMEMGGKVDADVPGGCEWRESSAHRCVWACTGRAPVWSAPVVGDSAANNAVATARPCRRDEKRVAEGAKANVFEQNSC